MSPHRIAELAGLLVSAQRDRAPISPLADRGQEISVEDAYAIQREIVRTRLISGDRIVGWKVGLTSRAMQQMLGVDTPDYGPVLESMVVSDGGSIAIGELIQPKVEAEIAFVLREDLQGPGVTPLDVVRATAGVVASLEVIDSRIQDWRITLVDTVADMASSARVVLSDRIVPLDGLDLRVLGMVLRRRGAIVETGAGAAVLGNPVHAVAWAANTLGSLGETLRAGQIVMPGALHRAVDVEADDLVEAEFDRLGAVRVRFDRSVDERGPA